MAEDTTAQLVKTISSTVTLTAHNTGASGLEIMKAIAVVAMTSQAMYADDVKSDLVASIFDGLAIGMTE